MLEGRKGGPKKKSKKVFGWERDPQVKRGKTRRGLKKIRSTTFGRTPN